MAKQRKGRNIVQNFESGGTLDDIPQVHSESGGGISYAEKASVAAPLVPNEKTKFQSFWQFVQNWGALLGGGAVICGLIYYFARLDTTVDKIVEDVERYQGDVKEVKAQAGDFREKVAAMDVKSDNLAVRIGSIESDVDAVNVDVQKLKEVQAVLQDRAERPSNRVSAPAANSQPSK